MTEAHWRSFIKAITWRLFGSLDTFILSWIITGHIVIALTITSVEFFTKILLYWLHERIWLKISFGKINGN